MASFVFALSYGASDFYQGWMKNPRSAMISCNDGFRPVSFYLEVIDDWFWNTYSLIKVNYMCWGCSSVNKSMQIFISAKKWGAHRLAISIYWCFWYKYIPYNFYMLRIDSGAFLAIYVIFYISSYYVIKKDEQNVQNVHPFLCN